MYKKVFCHVLGINSAAIGIAVTITIGIAMENNTMPYSRMYDPLLDVGVTGGVGVGVGGSSLMENLSVMEVTTGVKQEHVGYSTAINISQPYNASQLTQLQKFGMHYRVSHL